jgi:hypothetical protein
MSMLPCLIAATLAAVPPVSNPIRVAEVARKVAAHGTTKEDRSAAEKELMGHDPEVVLPVLAAEIDGAVDGAGDAVKGYAAEEEPTAEARAWRALHRLWDHHVWGKTEVVWVEVTESDGKKRMLPGLKRFRPDRKQAAVGKVLTAILKDTRSEHTRRLAILGLQENYSSDAEAPLAAILREEKSLDTMTAARILLVQHAAKYGPLVIDRASDARREVPERNEYLRVLYGIPLDDLGAADRKRLVRAGFAVLGENRCYFTAGWLEWFTGRQFKPDQGAAKYRGANGLTDDFFKDTVKNALAWWADNRKRYE